jgi:hypothetical protein
LRPTACEYINPRVKKGGNENTERLGIFHRHQQNILGNVLNDITGLSPKNRDRNCGDGISRGEEGNKQVA